MVETRNFNHILIINTLKQTALVQSNVPMDKLVSATLKHGLIPLVVTEFPGSPLVALFRVGPLRPLRINGDFLARLLTLLR
jgi:hypothetical protein